MILVNSIFYLLKGDYNWLQWVGDNLCNYILVQGCEKMFVSILPVCGACIFKTWSNQEVWFQALGLGFRV